MRIIVYAPYAYKLRYFETELELAQKHLDAGDEVTVLTCQAKMPECDMKQQRQYVCVRCMGRSAHGLSLLEGDVTCEPFYHLSDHEEQQLRELKTDIFDHESLSQLRVDNFDIGWAALSSIVSIHRDPYVDLRANADQLDGLLRSAWSVYHSVRRRLREQSVDRMYVFNGRHAPMRAAFRACQAEGVECLLHERGNDFRHYELYRNAMPHDCDYFVEQAEAAWEASTVQEEAEGLGAGWFQDRSQGVEQVGVSFIQGQQQGQLPENWDAQRRNVAVFVSSENEFVAIGDSWKNPLYESQLDGLQKMIDSLESIDTDLHLYIRVHPNLCFVHNQQTRGLAELKSPRVTVIPADDPICSYSLLLGCEKVLTFGSTMGIEAAYWQRPSILAGMSFYREMGATYNPTSHQQLMDLLHQQLEPRPQLPAIKYGHYMATFGIEYEHYLPETRYEGRFRGEWVKPTRSSWVKSRFVKLYGSAQKRIKRLKPRKAA
ncbi:MAG: hypothetical protein P8N76_02540 [Pirellulaceae bacterium]|nr:hypothetical protein [Pirellulaceae bacterium]